MLSLPSAQVKDLFLIQGLTSDYTVKHTMSPDCIAAHERRMGRAWMVVLRDGEWFVYCRCGWRSDASPTLTLGTAGHICGRASTPAYRGVRAGPALQQGGCLSVSQARNM
jgi:hypothetical protein